MIYLIITTSLVSKHGIHNPEHRNARYKLCINAILTCVNGDPEIKPIIVENNGVRKTFLDEFPCDIVYTNNNNVRCTHKGVNELMDIHNVLTKYNVNDDDIIIKLTGRYKILDDSFIKTVKTNSHMYDAFIKFFNVCTQAFCKEKDDCVLGLFALRYKFLKIFQYSLKKSPEIEFAVFIRDIISKERLMDIDNLHLECCFADNLRILNV